MAPLPCIYGIRHKVSGKMYVGQTKRKVETRWKQHMTDDGCPYIHNALVKHGKDAFDFFVIAWCIKTELDYNEKKYIQEYNTFGKGRGYNLKTGGADNITFTDETRKRISDKVSGEKNPCFGRVGALHPQFGKTGALSPTFGRKQSEEWVRKQSERQQANGGNFLGKTHTDETKKKLSIARKGKPLSEEHKAKIRKSQEGKPHPTARKVSQFDLEGKFLKAFDSILEAKKSIKKGDISACVQGRTQSAGGYIWKYSNNLETDKSVV